MFELGVKFLFSYLIGSIMGALTIGKLSGNVDIRDVGSGNAGGTNALRTQGFLFALGVVIIDVGKGIVAVSFIPQWTLPLTVNELQIGHEALVLCCASAAVMGHVWPVWHQFRGGKGAATLIGAYLALSPFLVVIILAVFIVTLIVFGFVGLSTMIAGASVAVFLLIKGTPYTDSLFIYAALMASYLIYTHRSNIQRMWRGTEPKNQKMMIFSKK